MNTIILQVNDQPTFHQDVKFSKDDYRLLAFEQNKFSIDNSKANDLMNDPHPKSWAAFEELLYKRVTKPYMEAKGFKQQSNDNGVVDVAHEVVSSQPLRARAQTLTLGGRK